MSLFDKAKKEKRVITGNDIGIICSGVGIVFSIILIGLNIIDHEGLEIGIVLLCACTVNLIVNIRFKKNIK